MMQIVSGACYTLGVLIMLTAWAFMVGKIFEAKADAIEAKVIQQAENIAKYGPGAFE